MNAIRFWNDVALEANRNDHSIPAGETKASPENGGPTLSARALAMVHLAIHDAHFGAQGFAVHGPYLAGFAAAPTPVDATASVAAAADAVLRALYPKKTADFQSAWQRSPGQPYATDAVLYGRWVAKKLLDVRAGDVPAERSYAPARRDDHREDPENPGQGFYGTTHGAIRLFAVRNPITLADPRGLVTMTTTKDAREKGGAPDQATTTRTTDESVAAIYWAYDGAHRLGTPPRLYNKVLKALSDTKQNTPDDDARLFALANTAMADAGFLAWGEKYKHAFWRPVIGVREEDPSTGPMGAAGPGVGSPVFWRPLGAPRTNTKDGPFTPNFPAYPSGHATFGAAAFQAARLFYGQKKVDRRKPDKLAFEFVSSELDGISTGVLGGVRTRVNRKFPSLWKAIEENALSRLFLGVHWKFDSFGKSPTYEDSIGGVPLGLASAEDIFDNGLSQAP